MNKHYYVYILTNRQNAVLYTGFTGKPLKQRIWEHKTKVIKGFTQKYNVDKLVYYEIYEDPTTAITREKQIKAGSRNKKLDIINRTNPNWEDLYDQID